MSPLFNFTRSFSKASLSGSVSVPAGEHLLNGELLYEVMNSPPAGEDPETWRLSLAGELLVNSLDESADSRMDFLMEVFWNNVDTDLSQFDYTTRRKAVTWFLRDKEYRDGRGIVRINVVGIDECAGFHNRKDRTVWILPSPDARIYDVWRRGKRWEDERDLCLALLEKGIPSGSDTDPFFGVDEQYRGFLERIGVRIEETTEPVAFLAGTWSLVDDYLHD